MEKKRLNPILVIIFLGFYCGVNSIGQTGPGGIGGIEDDIEPGEPINCIWLRAEDLTNDLNDGDPVLEWDNFIDYDIVATPPDGREDIEPPVFETNKINGYPWVKFNGNSFLSIEDNEVLDGGSGLGIFVVLQFSPPPDQVVDQKYNNSTIVCKRKHWNAWSHVPEISLDAEGLQHAYELRFDISDPDPDAGKTGGWGMVGFLNGNLPDGNGQDCYTRMINDLIDKDMLISWTYNQRWGGNVRVNGNHESSPNRGEGNPNPIYVGDVINSTEPLYIGAAKLDPPGDHGAENAGKEDSYPEATEQALFYGGISELIIFKGELDSTQLEITETYLSTKYNITIENDALDFSDDEYTLDLIGIGNATGSDKHTLSTGEALSLEELNNTLDAGEYVLAAHNAEYHAFIETNLPEEFIQRWSREWRIEVTGKVAAQITFNFSIAGLKMDDYREYSLLFRNSNEEDFVALTAQPVKKFNSIVFDVPENELITGYFTLGKKGEKSSDIRTNFYGTKIQVYPNPANDRIYLDFKNPKKGMVFITIRDLTGKVISFQERNKTAEEFKETLCLKNLTQGAYLLQVHFENERKTFLIHKH